MTNVKYTGNIIKSNIYLLNLSCEAGKGKKYWKIADIIQAVHRRMAFFIMKFRLKSKILDAKQLDSLIKRIACQIIEKNHSMEKLAIVGIHSRGVSIAKKIVFLIKEIKKKEPFFGTLDIALYRDDLTTIARHPVVKKTEIDFDVNGKTIVLIDDVLFTGRTIRCALDAIADYGRPEKIQLAVLVDRGHREIPIRPDYIGKNLPTSKKEAVQVRLKDIDGKNEIVIEEPVK